MMPEMIMYLLKVNIALLLFYAGYHFVLQRYTFHTLNRFYLLIGLIYSALYPLIDLSGMLNGNEQLKERINMLTPDWQAPVTYVINQAETGAGNYWQIALVIFWTGVIVMSLRLTIQLISLLILHIQSRSFTLGTFKFRKISKAVNPFSFWRTIYLNPDCHEASELNSILEHEQVHVKQLHTLDVMLAELSTIFYWFNPGVWLMKKAIKANLEFITDQQVILSGIDSREYQYTLLKSHVLPQNSMPVNNFHFLTIKKRIAMINKKPSNRINVSNYLLLVPSIMLLVLLTGISKAEFSGSVVETLTQLPKISRFPVISESSSPASQSLQSSSQDKVNSIGTKKNLNIPAATVADTNKIVNGVVVVTGKPFSNAPEGSLIQIDTNVNSKPLYVLDGKIMTNGLKNLASERIESIHVLKGERAIKQYGAEGKNGVVEIQTKSSAPGQSSNDLKEVIVLGRSRSDAARPSLNDLKEVVVVGHNSSQNISLKEIDNQLIILDGKEITKAELDQLKVTSIGTINIYKGNSAKVKYGEKGKNGVIVITTK